MPAAAGCQSQIDETSQDLRTGRRVRRGVPVTIKMITGPSNSHRFHSNSADRTDRDGGLKNTGCISTYATRWVNRIAVKTTFAVRLVAF